jgi:hypothetical protein
VGCGVICAYHGVWGEGWNQIEIRGVGVEIVLPRAKSVKLRYNTSTPRRSCRGAVEVH